MSLRTSRLFALGILPIALASAPHASAQMFPTPVPDHVQMAVPDPGKAVDWYVKHFGGTKVSDPRANQISEVGFGPTVFRFLKRDDATPSDGSVIDRVVFTVSDVAAKSAEVVADGGKILRAVQPPAQPGGNQLAFLQDPWGIKIEALYVQGETPRLWSIVLRAPDPEPLLKWISDTFGGTRDKMFGRFDGFNYGNLWILVQKSDTDVRPSSGQAIDHLGWAVPNMKEALPLLKGRGYKITVEPHKSGPLMLANIEGPNGFSVELSQNTNLSAK